MKKKLILILLLLLICSSLAGAQSKYEDLKSEAEVLRQKMMTRRDEIAAEKSQYKQELSELYEEKRDDAKSFKLMAEQTTDNAKAEQYRYNARLNKFLADLIEDNLVYGFSQLNPSNKELINNIRGDFEFHWHPGGGLETLEKLAGIYFLSYENNKLVFLEKLIHENRSTGIAENIRNYYQDDLDQRWDNKAPDPGDYNGAVIWSNREQPTYDLLYKIHKEFKKLADEEQLRIIKAEEEKLEKDNDRNTDTPEQKDNTIETPEINIEERGHFTNTITFSRGEVYLKRGGSKNLVDSNISTRLTLGVELSTESDIAYAEVSLADYEDSKNLDYKLLLWPEAAVAFDQKLLIKSGFVQIVKKQSSMAVENELDFETSKSVAEFKGNNLIVYLDSEGNAVYFIKNGELVVESKTFEQRTVLNSGQTIIVFEDGYLSRVEEMTADDYEIFDINIREYWESENQGL